MKFSSLFVLASAALGAWSTPVAVEVQERDLISDIGNLAQIIQDINVFITLDSLITNLVSINFDVKNDLILPLQIKSISSKAVVNGTTFATFSTTFKNFVVPPLGKANSGTINNVLLTQGATASLSIIPLMKLDVQSAILDVKVLLVEVPKLPYAQDNVPTTYTLDLS